MTEHVTIPHGWPVVTDRYGSPYTETGDVGVSFVRGGSVTACIADGCEREDVNLTADEARSYAKDLLEAADILDAFTSGEYVPPESSYVPKPMDPLIEKAMFAYLGGITKMLSTSNLLDGLGERDD